MTVAQVVIPKLLLSTNGEVFFTMDVSAGEVHSTSYWLADSTFTLPAPSLLKCCCDSRTTCYSVPVTLFSPTRLQDKTAFIQDMTVMFYWCRNAGMYSIGPLFECGSNHRQYSSNMNYECVFLCWILKACNGPHIGLYIISLPHGTKAYEIEHLIRKNNTGK